MIFNLPLQVSSYSMCIIHIYNLFLLEEKLKAVEILTWLLIQNHSVPLLAPPIVPKSALLLWTADRSQHTEMHQ